MQERNFEKQVREKMEELSLTPSEPVWKKINEQVHKKRERRRIFLWLPLAALMLGGGVWFVSTNFQTKNHTQSPIVVNDVNKGTADLNKKTSVADHNITKEKNLKVKKDIETASITSTKEQSIDNKSISTNKHVVQSKNIDAAQDKPFVTSSNQKTSGSRKKGNTSGGTNQNTNIFANRKQTLTQTKPPAFVEQDNGDEKSIPALKNQKTSENKIDKAPAEKNVNNENRAEDLTPDKTSIADSSLDKTPVAAQQKDSLNVDNAIAATNRKSVSKKWRLALEAGVGVSGVNNGIDVFTGGAQSMESNAFARDMSLSFAAPTNSQVGGIAFRPPSLQKKSGSLLFGILAKKQLSKRTFFSTGLRYNFYSTTMKVGENVNRDTVVEANKSVGRFYTNSGNNFTDYHNDFHFVSVPLNLDFRLLNNLPLDLHLGLSVQQLIHTNALLYSASSQVYYNDKDVFNKTYLFSEVGLDYSIQLSKKLSLKAGPRAGYAFSKVITASDRHLFSYGMVTQLVFAGK